VTELTLETLREEIDALRALTGAHEELRGRFERFTYMPPELVEELERVSRKNERWRRKREERQR
jgi:hypothetical protein